MSKSTEDILRSMVPTHCKMVDGSLKPGFIDWESPEGKAINEALLAISKLQGIKEIVKDAEIKFDGQEFGASYCDLLDIIDNVREIAADNPDAVRRK